MARSKETKPTPKASTPKDSKSNLKRKNIRFEPDLDAFAYIDLKYDTKEFNPKISALIIDESFTGAALVLRSNDKIKTDSKIQIMPGRIGPLLAQVKWLKNHSGKVMEIGIEYLD